MIFSALQCILSKILFKAPLFDGFRAAFRSNTASMQLSLSCSRRTQRFRNRGPRGADGGGACPRSISPVDRIKRRL